MVVKYLHHGDDLVEHRTREASFGAQCTNLSANSLCFPFALIIQFNPILFIPPSGNWNQPSGNWNHLVKRLRKDHTAINQSIQLLFPYAKSIKILWNSKMNEYWHGKRNAKRSYVHLVSCHLISTASIIMNNCIYTVIMNYFHNYEKLYELFAYNQAMNYLLQQRYQMTSSLDVRHFVFSKLLFF